MSTGSLFLFHCSSNTGYAIAPLEKLFYEAGLELAEGDSNRVHFAYRSLARGRPANLPQDFNNIVEFDFHVAGAGQIRTLAEYARENQIRFALVFDIQPVHPLFRPLRRAGVRTILSYWGAPISWRVPLWKLTLKKLQIALSSSKVDGLIFESQAMADLGIHGRGVPHHMVDVVPLGVDTDRYKPARSHYVYEVMGLPKNRRVVIYSGHMEPRKGVRTLVEAAIDLLTQRKRTDVCFLLFGNKDDQSRQFEQMYEGLGVDRLICFGGYRPDLDRIFPGCFCGVIPSVGWDSFTYSAIEMAACGLPIIGSRLQGICESVRDRQTGLLFEPGNASELADRLTMLLDDPQLAKRYGEAGRKRCEEELNLDSQRRLFVQTIRKRLHDGPL